MKKYMEMKGLFDSDMTGDSVQPLDDWYAARGFGLIAGVDEAGRGALAGPVSAAAVIIGEAEIKGLNDSKKLTPKVREKLYEEIWENASGVGVALVGPGQIDSSNILIAAMDAMKLAVRMLPIRADIVLIDGGQVPSGMEDGVAIVKGDTRSQCIMAASIIAKVTRDWYMRRMAVMYPGYGFEIHKGYAVPAHYKALLELGLTPIHRLTFSPCRDLVEGLRGNPSQSTIGAHAAGEKDRI